MNHFLHIENLANAAELNIQRKPSEVFVRHAAGPNRSGSLAPIVFGFLGFLLMAFPWLKNVSRVSEVFFVCLGIILLLFALVTFFKMRTDYVNCSSKGIEWRYKFRRKALRWDEKLQLGWEKTLSKVNTGYLAKTFVLIDHFVVHEGEKITFLSYQLLDSPSLNVAPMAKALHELFLSTKNKREQSPVNLSAVNAL